MDSIEPISEKPLEIVSDHESEEDDKDQPNIVQRLGSVDSIKAEVLASKATNKGRILVNEEDERVDVDSKSYI